MSTNPTFAGARSLVQILFTSLFRSRTRIVAGIALSSLFLLGPPLASAQGTSYQSFLKIDGIEGDSTVKGREGDIDILGFTSGVQTEVAASGGSGSGAGKPVFYQIVVSKNVDSTSPLLMVNCALGTHFKSAALTVVKTNSAGSKNFFKVTLTNPVITKVETTIVSGSSDKLVEYVELSFEKILWTVRTTNSKGATVTTTGGYDLKTGTKL